MKKIITILLMLLAFTIKAQEPLILTQDTEIVNNATFSTVRTNGYNLYVHGELNVTRFIMLNKGNQETGGTVIAKNDINVGSNIFFFNDSGIVKSDWDAVRVSGDITGSGKIYYCTEFTNGFQDDVVYFNQSCESLSIPNFEFNFEEAKLLGRYNILGQSQGNILNGYYFAYYQSLDKRRIGKRKELWKDSIMISSTVISNDIMKQ